MPTITPSLKLITACNCRELETQLVATLQHDVNNNLSELDDYNDFETTILGLELVGEFHVNEDKQIDNIEINYVNNEPVDWRQKKAFSYFNWMLFYWF